MTLIIRTATPDDAAAIASVKARVWPAETPALDRIEQAIVHKDHATHVAHIADHAGTGFVDGFLTRSASGQQRWEVDLLAVDPAFQGQKIGQQLITASTLAGRAAGATRARALVQVENYASQGAFRQNGYRTTGQIYRLVVSRQAAADSPAVNPHLIPVSTMNYSGLWLEGDPSAAHLAAAQSERARQGCDLVGALLPLEATDLLIAARQMGYNTIEHFQWWALALDG
jgi:ribosomal protein S18 acetylase RimI-like enzyme